MKFIGKNISELLTMTSARQKQGRQILPQDLSLLKKAAIVWENGKILWVGEQKKIPKSLSRVKTKEVDFDGQTVLPGFVECHTHSLFAGSRSHEFEQRNQGVSYQEIAAQGGGILSTMRQTRKASPSDLKNLLSDKIKNFVRQGVTTLEVKTGYALDMKSEIKCLQVLNSDYKIRVVPTFLGAHAVPPEFSSGGEYLQYLAEMVLPQIKKLGLCQRVDIFIERGFFSFDEGLDYLQVAKDLGFETVVHADQLSLCGGADAALFMASRSADHLIQINSDLASNLAKSEVTCVLLPSADLYMKCAYPPARQLLDCGARVALATDFNPGSSPSQDLNLVGLLARLEMKMSLPEVINAYTVAPAYALGLENHVGSLQSGFGADFFSMSADWDQLFYSIGAQLPSRVFYSGKQIFG